MAWNRDMVGSPSAASMETACELIETSLAPAIAPKTESAPNNVAALIARPGMMRARENPTVLHIVTRLLPYRVTSQPVRGTATTDPTAVPSKQSPN